MKSKVILVIALVMAVITTILFKQYVTGIEKKYNDKQKKVNIVVLKKDIKKNQKIAKEDLELKEFTADSVHKDAVKKMEAIVGNYALTDMKAGEVLFANRFINQVQESELITRKIKEGYRAIAIGVNYVESVANLIQPEDYVDIIYTFTDDPTNKKFQTTTLFENVRVLAVGKRIIEKTDKGKDEKKDGDETAVKEVEYTSVTVELKPEDIVKIANSDEKGNIKFVLRSKITP